MIASAIGKDKNDDAYDLVGMVSWGPERCGSAGEPGIYTKIGPYLEWILDNLDDAYPGYL